MNITKSIKKEYSIMFDMIIVLVVLSGLAFYYYGLRSLIVIFFSVISCCVTDFICLKLRKMKLHIHDLSSVVTGFVLGLMFPASVPYHIVVIASLFAIIIGKQAFGGHGSEVFNCSVVGFIFALICFPQYVMFYPKPFDTLELSNIVSNPLFRETTLYGVGSSSVSVSVINFMTGNNIGAMGTTHILVLLVSAVFLMLRRTVSAIVFFTETIVIVMFSFFTNGMTFQSIILTLSGEMLLFSIIFLSCDFCTVPKTRTSRFVYAIIVSLLYIIIKCAEGTEYAIVYAVILATPFGIYLDKKALSFASFMNSRNYKLALLYNTHFKNVDETIKLLDGDKKENESDK